MLATAMANDFYSPFVSNFVFFGSGISDMRMVIHFAFCELINDDIV